MLAIINAYFISGINKIFVRAFRCWLNNNGEFIFINVVIGEACLFSLNNASHGAKAKVLSFFCKAFIIPNAIIAF